MFLKELAKILSANHVSDREYEIRDEKSKLVAGNSRVGFRLYFKDGKWIVDFVETDRGIPTYKYECANAKAACKTFLEKSNWAFNLSSFSEAF